MERLKWWIRLSRPEFHTVGIAPVILGAAVGYSVAGVFYLLPTALAILAVVLIMLATYWSGEVFDYEVDVLSAQMEKNKFSGGTLVLQRGGVPREKAFIGAVIVFVIAGLLGLAFLKMGYSYDLFLAGVIGGLMGFFYTTPPFRWAYRGVGETFIGFAYGYLPVAVGYHLQTKSWDLLPILLHGTPIAVSIFMVILINEFPDYPADLRVGKKNLVVRLGRERAAVVYVLSAVLFTLSIVIPAVLGYKPFLYALPVALLALFNAYRVGRGLWKDRKTLENICATTILINLGTAALLTIGVLL